MSVCQICTSGLWTNARAAASKAMVCLDHAFPNSSSSLDQTIFLFMIGWGGLNVVSLIVSAFFVLYAIIIFLALFRRENFLSSSRRNHLI
jgi:hypothetical protein